MSTAGTDGWPVYALRDRTTVPFVCDNFVERCGPDGGTQPRSICHICLQPRRLHAEPIETSWPSWLLREVLAELSA